MGETFLNYVSLMKYDDFALDIAVASGCAVAFLYKRLQ